MFEESRTAAEDAPEPREFERVFAAASKTDDRIRCIEDEYISFGSGRLGLRNGCLLHSNDSWVDRDQKVIQIPLEDDCDCRYCWEQAQKVAENHEDFTAQEIFEHYWSPKTRHGARKIYYGFSDRAIRVVETFFDEVGEFDYCQSTINRRIDSLAEEAGIRRNLYPHAFRAAAALFWAEKGLEAPYLQAMFGWKDMQIAHRYIRTSGRHMARRIDQLVEDGRLDGVEQVPPEDLPDPIEGMKNVTDDSPKQPPTPGSARPSKSLWDYATNERPSQA